MNDDPFSVLGVPRDAGPEQIHEAYFALARQCHPDINPDDPQAVEEFRRVQAAFEALDSPASRAKYDAAAHPHARAAAPGNSARDAADTAVNVAFLHGRARRRTPDPCAADFLYWPAVWLLILGLASIPIDLVLNTAFCSVIENQRSKTEEAEQFRQLVVEAFPLICVVQTTCSLLAIAGAISMFRVWSYPIALLGLAAVSVPAIGALYGLGIFHALWAFWPVYEMKESFRY